MIKTLLCLLSIQLLASASMATTYLIQNGQDVVRIKATKSKISFKDKNFAKTIKRKKCNQYVFDIFNSQLQKNANRLNTLKESMKAINSVNVKVGSAQKVALTNFKAKEYFSRMPSSVRNLYYTSKSVCKK